MISIDYHFSVAPNTGKYIKYFSENILRSNKRSIMLSWNSNWMISEHVIVRRNLKSKV